MLVANNSALLKPSFRTNEAATSAALTLRLSINHKQMMIFFVSIEETNPLIITSSNN